MNVSLKLIFIAMMSLGSFDHAAADASSQKDQDKYLELSMEGRAEKFTDHEIEQLLNILASQELTTLQYLIKKHSVDLKNVSKTNQQNAIENGRQIFETYSASSWSNPQDPSYVIPIVNIDGSEYLILNRDDFGQSNFDTLIPKKAVTDLQSGLKLRVYSTPKGSFIKISPLALGAIFMIFQDLCRTEYSSRSFLLKRQMNEDSYLEKEMQVTLDMKIFESLRKCSFN